MSVVLSGDSDFQPRIHQKVKPFVGRTLSRPAGGDLSAPQTSKRDWGKSPERCARGGKEKRGRNREKGIYRQWRIQDLQTGGRSSAAGASIEAPKAPRGMWGVWRKFPLPTGRGLWEGGSVPSQKFFSTLDLKISTSVHSERYFCSSATYCTSKKHCFWAYKNCCCNLHAMYSTETAKGITSLLESRNLTNSHFSNPAAHRMQSA